MATTALLDAHFDSESADRYGVALACVIQQHGVVAAERYGINPHTHEPVTPDTTLISWSMAKSFTHALVGMLVQDGLLDINARAPVPEWAGDSRREITLHQLLTMTSGVAFNEDYVDESSHCVEMLFGSGQSDTAAYAAALPLIHTPGTVFNYSSGTTNIISRICGDALGGGAATLDYIQARLFDPLQMTSATVRLDQSGTFVGSSFVFATAREFGRFGQLYLQDGVWDSQRLLPSGWVDAARTPVPVRVDEDHHYGAHWWLWKDPVGFGAHGFEGQYTLVFPDTDLVIVRLGVSPTDDQKAQTRKWLGELANSFDP